MHVTIEAIDARHPKGAPLDEFDVSGFGVAYEIGSRVASALQKAPAGTDHLTVTVRGLSARVGEEAAA